MSEPEVCESLPFSTIAPKNELKFKLVSEITNTEVEDGIITTPGTINKKLKLCCNIVEFDNIECSDLNALILGIPITFSDKCNLYSLDIPNISDDSLINEYMVVTCGDDNNLVVDIQVANGYIYIIIDVPNDKVIHSNETCLGSLVLCFETFCFDINKKVPLCHKVKCRPVTWSYGCLPPTTSNV